jgi:hypothetical protein
LYQTKEAPYYKRGLRSNLALFVVLIGLYAAQVLYLYTLNKRKAQTRVAMGLSANIEDRSMQKVREYATKEEAESAQDAGRTAFDDRTDFENPNFVYVY